MGMRDNCTAACHVHPNLITGQTCQLRFYTHMQGGSIGELNVYLENSAGHKDRKLHLTNGN